MKSWFIQLAGALLVLAFALTVGGFVMVLRAQQNGLAATMAAANIHAVSPADGAVNVPVSGEFRADYISRPTQDPTIKVEPPVGVALGPGHWDGTTFVVPYSGLAENSLYHVELDQDDWTGKGEHKQIKVRWSFRTGALPTTSATPKPTPAVSPTSTPSSPPSATPNLIWYSGQNGASASGQNGIDWNGQLVKNPRWVGTTQAPNGRRIYDGITPSTWINDADGNHVGSVAGSGMWADDSSRFCGIAHLTTSAPYSLIIMPLDGSMHTVGTISMTPGTNQSPQVAACSVLSGRAIVIGESNGYVWSVSLVSLTDGSVIYKRSYPNPLTRLVASHDGRYVAEQLAGNASGTSTTIIRELPSGNVVSQLTGISVQGFSWDGSLVAGGVQNNSGLTGAEVIRWQDRQVLWNRCGCASPYTVKVIAQPGGNRLAIGAYDQHGVGSLTIVDGNGAIIAVPVSYGPFLPLF